MLSLFEKKKRFLNSAAAVVFCCHSRANFSRLVGWIVAASFILCLLLCQDFLSIELLVLAFLCALPWLLRL